MLSFNQIYLEEGLGDWLQAKQQAFANSNTGKSLGKKWRTFSTFAPETLGMIGTLGLLSTPLAGPLGISSTLAGQITSGALGLSALGQGIGQLPMIKPTINRVKSIYRQARNQGQGRLDSMKQAISQNGSQLFNLALTPVEVAAGALGAAGSGAAQLTTIASRTGRSLNSMKYQADAIDRKVDNYLEQEKFNKMTPEEQHNYMRNKRIQQLQQLDQQTQQQRQQLIQAINTPYTPPQQQPSQVPQKG